MMQKRLIERWFLGAACLITFIAPTPLAAAPDAVATAVATAASAAPPALPALPPEVERFWQQALDLEPQFAGDEEIDPSTTQVRFMQSAEFFEKAAEGGKPNAYWRAARMMWLAGDTLPLEDTEGRLVLLNRALDLTDRGLAVNPDCAECMLWKFISMGRLRTTMSVWSGMRQVSEMAEMLDRAFELNPSYADNDNNSTLGNLHYSSAILYRLIPEWFWIRWMLGVKGDKERALGHARSALVLHPKRVDYKVEVGTQLLCLGTLREDPGRLAEGRIVMKSAIAGRATSQDERRELHFARIMLDDPTKACGYSGDKILEIDEEKAKADSKRAKDTTGSE